MQDNEDWMLAFPMLSPWFLPQADLVDEEYGVYQRRARNWAIANDFRLRRSPEEFLSQLYFAEGAEPYFKEQQQYRELRESLRLRDRTEEVRVLDQMWNTWSKAWLGQHPVFARDMAGGEARQRREDIVEQARLVLADEAAIPQVRRQLPKHQLTIPQVGHRDGMIQMLRLVVGFADTMDQLSGAPGADATTLRNHYRAELYNQAQLLVILDPALETFFNSVIIPLIETENVVKLMIRGELNG